MINFYNQNITAQWMLAVLMLMVPLLFVLFLLNIFREYTITACFLALFVPSLVQFFVAPFAKLTGHHQYLSSMLLFYSVGNKKYALPNGTSFDYLMHMRNVKPGFNFNKRLLVFYIDGLLRLVDKIEANEIEEASVFQGSSYFFNERTAKRLGFNSENTNRFLKIHFCINFIDLTWMYSLSQGRLSFPNITKIQTISISATTLALNKEKILKLRLSLTKSRSRKTIEVEK
ncbi:MAG: hypothetical protein GJ680_14835 [Alteromonadaceae bacterium]|nr:hypothetical protein [Alteromonadaceae bacterium]